MANTGVLTDDEVMQAPASAGLSDDEVMQAPQGGGGITETAPSAIDLMSTPEGRAKLWGGVEKEFPVIPDVRNAETWLGVAGTLAEHFVNQFVGMAKSAMEANTPEERAAAGFNAALMTIGSGPFRMPKASVAAVAPVMREFEEGVIAPLAEKILEPS